MKTIDLAVRQTTLQELLRLASEENVTLRTPEGREYIVVELDSFEHELERTRNDPALMQLLEERSAEEPTYSLDQVRQRLGL